MVILKDGEIALIKRGNQPALGKWTVPGGLVELGESLEDAAIREAKEETCLIVEKPRLLGVVDQIDRDEDGKIKYHYVIIDYLVRVVSGNIAAASDAAELRWVTLSEVENYDLTASFRRFFRQNRKSLAEVSSF
ncbi:MAG: NUDIX hydrolase [Candidatus Bathyarchaeota archaeon]|nr:NUDIX hydrolase [Candidatus Bathyarchaeota archaeon]